MVTKAKKHSDFQYWCPRVQKNKKCREGQIDRNWLAGKSYFLRGRIFISCFSEPLGYQYWNSEWSFSLVTIFCLNLFWRGVSNQHCVICVNRPDLSKKNVLECQTIKCWIFLLFIHPKQGRRKQGFNWKYKMISNKSNHCKYLDFTHKRLNYVVQFP